MDPGRTACDHRSCKCEETPVTSGPARWCSEHCAECDRAGTEEKECGCGHPACGVSIVAPFAKGRPTKSEWF